MDGIWDIFLSTPSARRATSFHVYDWLIRLISIHALREEGDPTALCPCFVQSQISIHALREEGDGGRWSKAGAIADFYPRPPRGGRLVAAARRRTELIFLSTPSARRATVHLLSVVLEHLEISIHALREEGDYARPGQSRPNNPISIHALREEGDMRPCQTCSCRPLFLSTPSARRATCSCRRRVPPAGISIHALREEGDATRTGLASASANFYPRPPRGGRRVARCSRELTEEFLSTPSARRATRGRKG